MSLAILKRDISANRTAREVPGFPGYIVTREGTVLGRGGKVLKLQVNPRSGYVSVNLWKHNCGAQEAVRLRQTVLDDGWVSRSLRLRAHSRDGRGAVVIYDFPLSWPIGLKRTAYPTRSRFDTAEERVKRDLEQQLLLMRATDVVVTTNCELRRDGRPYANQRIEDMGVAVYFKRKGQDQVIACDRWNSIRDNLQAIAKTIEALRAITRWGTGEMVDAAYAGFTAIPANASAGRRKRPWHEVLGVSPDAPREVVEAAGKAMQRKTHPDVGGTDVDFQEVQDAIEEATR